MQLNQPEPSELGDSRTPGLRILRRWIRVAVAVALVAVAIREGYRSWFGPGSRIPARLKSALPVSCRQVVLVLSPSAESVPAQMWFLQRRSSSHRWELNAGPIDVTLGRNGLAWGEGEHGGAALPPGFRIKQEGDGCSPAGVFRIPFAFGYANRDAAGAVRLPYVHVTDQLVGVDDVKSKFYNQVIDSSAVEPDWDSRETMLRPDGLYRWGAFIAHNPRNQTGGGSCIFFHLWNGPDRPTAGCTALAETDVEKLLAWLDPAMDPRLVQGLSEW